MSISDDTSSGKIPLVKDQRHFYVREGNHGYITYKDNGYYIEEITVGGIDSDPDEFPNPLVIKIDGFYIVELWIEANSFNWSSKFFEENGTQVSFSTATAYSRLIVCHGQEFVDGYKIVDMSIDRLIPFLYERDRNEERARALNDFNSSKFTSYDQNSEIRFYKNQSSRSSPYETLSFKTKREARVRVEFSREMEISDFNLFISKICDELSIFCGGVGSEINGFVADGHYKAFRFHPDPRELNFRRLMSGSWGCFDDSSVEKFVRFVEGLRKSESISKGTYSRLLKLLDKKIEPIDRMRFGFEICEPLIRNIVKNDIRNFKVARKCVADAYRSNRSKKLEHPKHLSHAQIANIIHVCVKDAYIWRCSAKILKDSRNAMAHGLEITDAMIVASSAAAIHLSYVCVLIIMYNSGLNVEDAWKVVESRMPY